MARFASPYELDEIYGTLVDRQYPLPRQLQGHFGQVINFTTETIDLDKVSPDLRIGIFVAPNVNAKPTTVRGYQTKVFYPGYWKDKATVHFNNLRKRRPGEPLATPQTTAGKIALALQDAMDLMEAKRIRLMEYMAAQAILYGNYIISSELHPSLQVDLEPNIATHLTNEGTSTGTVPAAQAVSLASGRANRANISGTNVTGPSGQIIPTLGTNRNWGGASHTPIADLQSMLDAAWEPISVIYMDNAAWEKLQTDTNFDKVIDRTKSLMNQFSVDLLPKQQSVEGLKLRGVLGAQNIPIITYTAQYQPTNSTTLSNYLPAGWVVMMPASSFGVQAFGAIQHGAADFASKEVFWNSWMEDEGGQPWLQGQSAPVLLHTKINSTVAWKVM